MTVSPILSCLIWLTEFYGAKVSVDKILCGLPSNAAELGLDLLERAAENANLDHYKKTLSTNLEPDQASFPFLVVNNGNPLLITGVLGSIATVIRPYESRSSETMEWRELFVNHKSVVYFFALKSPLDHRHHDEQGLEHHWFWGALLSGWKIYREVLLASLLVNLFALAVPLFVRLIYDRVIPGMAMTTLNTLAVGVLLVVTFELFCRQLRTRFIDVAAKKTDLLMSSQLFAKVMNVDLSSVPPVAGAFARQVQNFESIREFLTSTTLTVMVEIPFAILFLAVIGVIGSTILWIPIVVILLMITLSIAIQPALRRSIQQGEKLAIQKQGDLVECISGLESLRLAGGQSYFQKRWEQATGMMATCGLKTRGITGNISGLSVWLQQLTTIGILYFGVRSIQSSSINMGALIAIMMLSGRAVAPFMQLSLLGARYWQAKSAYTNINGLMLAPEETRRRQTEYPIAQLRGGIVFDKVSFTYPCGFSAVIKDVSFAIKPGEKVAIVGRSGSGKSTLARLLAALYLPDSGQILVDGINLCDIHPAALRRRIGFLAQEPWLFNGAVMSNIAMGITDKAEKHILEVAKKSGVTMFTGDAVAGLECQVGEGGQRLSGGQRRSVALARALVNSPDILVLDEPSAHMDSIMDNRVQQTLRELPGHVALLVITHRSSLLSIVDRVLMLEDGQLISDQTVTKRKACG